MRNDAHTIGSNVWVEATYCRVNYVNGREASETEIIRGNIEEFATINIGSHWACRMSKVEITDQDILLTRSRSRSWYLSLKNQGVAWFWSPNRRPVGCSNCESKA